MAEVEKGEHTEHLEQVATRDADITPQTSLEKVDTHETLAKVDIHNHQAYKGDDSDGKFNWNIRNWLAAVSLAMLYTGETQTAFC